MLARRGKYPNTVGVIMRRVLADVKENHIQKFWEEFPELRQFYNADQYYVIQSRGWHLPAYWGPSESGGQGGSTYNKYWACLSEFRRSMSLPVLDPNLAGTGPDGSSVNNASVLGYVPNKWYCPKAARGQQDGYFFGRPGSSPSFDHRNQIFQWPQRHLLPPARRAGRALRAAQVPEDGLHHPGSNGSGRAASPRVILMAATLGGAGRLT